MESEGQVGGSHPAYKQLMSEKSEGPEVARPDPTWGRQLATVVAAARPYRYVMLCQAVVVAAALIALVAINYHGSAPADSPYAGGPTSPPSATAAAGDGYLWSLSELPTQSIGEWSTSSTVVIGMRSGLAAYNLADGRRLWDWAPPAGDDLCEMTQMPDSHGIGYVSVGVKYACTSVQAINIATGETALDATSQATVRSLRTVDGVGCGSGAESGGLVYTLVGCGTSNAALTQIEIDGAVGGKQVAVLDASSIPGNECPSFGYLWLNNGHILITCGNMQLFSIASGTTTPVLLHLSDGTSMTQNIYSSQIADTSVYGSELYTSGDQIAGAVDLTTGKALWSQNLQSECPSAATVVESDSSGPEILCQNGKTASLMQLAAADGAMLAAYPLPTNDSGFIDNPYVRVLFAQGRYLVLELTNTQKGESADYRDGIAVVKAG